MDNKPTKIKRARLAPDNSGAEAAPPAYETSAEPAPPSETDMFSPRTDEPAVVLVGDAPRELPAFLLRKPRTETVARSTPSHAAPVKRQSESDAEAFIQMCKTPISDEEHEATVARAIAWTKTKRATAGNYGPLLTFGVVKGETRSKHAFVAYKAFRATTNSDGTVTRRSIDQKTFITPIMRFGPAYLNLISMTGNYRNAATQFQKSSSTEASRTASLVQLANDPDMPDIVAEDTTAFLNAITTFQLTEALDYQLSVKAATSTDTRESVIAKMRDEGETSQQFAVRHSQDPDAKYVTLPLTTSVTTMHSWDPSYNQGTGDDPQKQAAAKIEAARREWAVVQEHPFFYGVNLAGGVVNPDSLMPEALSDAEKTFSTNPVKNPKKNAYGFTDTPIMLTDFTQLASSSIDALIAENPANWVGFAVCSMPKAPKKNPYNNQYRFTALFLLGRMKGGIKSGTAGEELDESLCNM
jgi:hypothetical protein